MAARYFPMSQEFNSDPEAWELTDSFGDRALRVWIEVLSILDREKNSWKLVSGWDSVVSRKIRQSPETVRKVINWMLQRGWLEVGGWLADGPPDLGQWLASGWPVVGQWSAEYQPAILRAPNYRKFRKLGAEAQPPPNLTEPNLTEPTKRREDNTCHLAAVPAKWPNVELLIKKYNEETPGQVPAVERITPARVKKAREYLKLFPEESFWTEAFQELGRSDFLLGRKNGTGHESFRANFDWLLSKGKDQVENVVKVYEGRYRNGR